MAKYKLIGSPHAGSGIDSKDHRVQHYKKGDVVESEDNLCLLFPNKFELIESSKSAAPPPPRKHAENPFQVEPAIVEGNEEEDEEEEDEESPLGKNVTGRKVFKKEKKAGFVVYETKDKMYNVAEKTNPTIALNDEPLTKANLSLFLKDLNK